MKRVEIIFYNLILIPPLILLSSIKTGDAKSSSTVIINTGDQNSVVQNNSSSSYSNTGGNSSSGSVKTGDATAVSEINIDNGQVEGKLEVEANGDKKELIITSPGSYKLELEKKASTSASRSTPKSDKFNLYTLFKSLLDSLLSFIKQK